MISVMELLPKANEEDFRLTKEHLENYQTYKGHIREFGGKPLSPSSMKDYNQMVFLVENIEKAVSLIAKKDIRRLVELRYIDGLEHNQLVIRFAHIDPSTVDRRINRGIQSVANTLKFVT